jgi:hypothetical protein
MRLVGGFCLSLLLAVGLFAQNRGAFVNPQPFVTGGFGNVVFPGGTPATVPGTQRFFGNVAFPGGGGPHLVVPGSPAFGRSTRRSNVVAVPYAYPVYVGGYGYGYSNDSNATAAPAPAQQQPNVTVVYPPDTARPIIINFGSGDGQYAPASQQPSVYQPADRQPSDSTAADVEPARYLIAFKDHTIYSAIAYWVDGDTLHYFTSGNTHNQVSLSLIDRDLTSRLNRESGVDVKLPAAR